MVISMEQKTFTLVEAAVELNMSYAQITTWLHRHRHPDWIVPKYDDNRRRLLSGNEIERIRQNLK